MELAIGRHHSKYFELLMQMPGLVAVIDGKNGKTLLESMLNSIKYENWYLTDFYARMHGSTGSS